MYKVKNNNNTPGCTPTSSDCVIWQGPCLDCININTGDTVSQAIAELAAQLCDIQGLTGISDIDLKCLFDASSGSPAPEKTIANILQLLITKTCTLEEIIDGLSGQGGYTLPNVNIAACFQTTDLNGDIVTSMRLDLYTQAIGIKVCALQSTVNQHTTTIANHETRITTLENAPVPEFVLPSITPVCVITGGTPQPIDDVLEALESQFCGLRLVTGLPTELSQAIGKQCVNLNTSPALSQPGTMSAISGWKNTVSTVADSLNNIWLTICDMRAAVAAVKTCCDPTCADVVIDFLVSIADNGATGKLYFAGYTHLPTGFTNCSPSGSVLTITDGMGGTYTLNVDIVTASASNDPITIDFTITGLAPGATYSFSLASCMSNSSLTCNKTVIKTASTSSSVCTIPSDVTATIS